MFKTPQITPKLTHFLGEISGRSPPSSPPPTNVVIQDLIPLYFANATVFGKGLIHHNLCGQT